MKSSLRPSAGVRLHPVMPASWATSKYLHIHARQAPSCCAGCEFGSGGVGGVAEGRERSLAVNLLERLDMLGDKGDGHDHEVAHAVLRELLDLVLRVRP